MIHNGQTQEPGTGLITQHMSSMYVITNYLDDPQKQQPKIVLFSKKLFLPHGQPNVDIFQARYVSARTGTYNTYTLPPGPSL